MTHEEYQRICDRLARKAIAYAARRAEEEDSSNVTDEREHWIDVFLDEHLPDVDADVLLDVTSHADAWLNGRAYIVKADNEAKGSFYAAAEVRATAAFQADVWDAINRTETP